MKRLTACLNADDARKCRQISYLTVMVIFFETTGGLNG